jgi:probable F420-dependent oxidoreductase
MERWGLTFPLDGIPLSDHRAIFEEMESLGYTDAWTAEADGSDALVPIGAAAAMSKSLRLGSAIANVFTRGPALLAQQAASANEAAPGRFVLGIGASSHAIVENWNGVAFNEPLTRTREVLSFLRAAFAGEKAASESLGVRGFRLGRRFGEPPPIFVAALRKKMLQLAGGESDGVVINWLGANDVPKVVQVAREAAQKAARDPEKLEVACRIFVLDAPNDDVARAIARRAVTGYLTTPVYSAFHRWLGRGEILGPMNEAWAAGDRQSAVGLVPEQVIDDLFAFGDRNTRLDKVEAYARAGVTVPIMNFLVAEPDARKRAERTRALVNEMAKA